MFPSSIWKDEKPFFPRGGKARKDWRGHRNGKEVWFSATRAGLQRQIYAVDLNGHLRLAFRALGGVTLQDIAPDGRVLMTRDEHRAGIRGAGARSYKRAGTFVARLVASRGHFAGRQNAAL